MNEKLAKTLSTLLIFAMILSAIPAFAGLPSEPHNANAMWIEPSTISLSTANPAHTVGYKFNITVAVNISTTEEIGAWQARVNFNPAYVKAVRMGLTEGTKSNWFKTFSCFAADPTLDNVTGYVFWGETILGAAVLSPGAGTLFWIEFQVESVPAKGEEITMTFVLDPAKSFVLDESESEIPMTKYNAQYTFTWAEPTTKPKLAVDPTLKEFGPDPPSAVGAAFDVKVYVRSLSAAWGLTNVSFTLSYNTTLIDVLGEVANITFNTADFDGTNEAVVTHGTPLDTIDVVARTTKTLSGDVLVVTIKFTVMHQEESPPAPPFPWAEVSPLALSNEHMFDHIMELPRDPSVSGQVKIYALRTLPLAWLEISPPEVVMGPEPSVCKNFDVDVVVKDLDKAWYVVAYQFRILFNATLIMGVEATEGPFFQDPKWNLHGTFFTFEIEEDPVYGWNVVVGGILLPNATTGEYDQTEFPNCDNVTGAVLATVTFHVEYQRRAPCNFTGAFDECDLELIAFWEDGSEAFIDRDGNYVPTDYGKYVHGHYKIIETPSGNGRIIDVYGGAVNRLYGVPFSETEPSAFPAPYGGQGQGGNMDLVIPQSVVYLLSRVTYNCWPVQSKDVGFELEGPFEQEGWTPEDPVPRQTRYFTVRKYAGRTDDDGIAWVKFQMIWPCEDPEETFGKYRVTASVDICGVVVTDVLWFDYYYLVEITKVTTDKFYYEHCEDVEVTIQFRSKAQQEYPVLFSVVIQDELETHFGAALVSMNVSGAEFCHWKEYETTVTIHVIKWAFAGYAKIYVSAYDVDPTDISPITGQHGAPWCPTFGLGWPPGSEVPEIYILPL